MFVSRRTGGDGRWTVWKVGILFLGAGTWVAGVLAENFQVTAAAIIIIAIGLILSLVERRVYRADDDGVTEKAAEEAGEPDTGDDDGLQRPRRWEDQTGADDEWRR
jgi:hypothetical protein